MIATFHGTKLNYDCLNEIIFFYLQNNLHFFLIFEHQLIRLCCMSVHPNDFLTRLCRIMQNYQVKAMV